MPEGTPGFGQIVISLDDKRKILVINLMTNLFMQENEFVFKSLEKILLNVELGKDYNAIFVDLHGEATSEKTALANHFDGRVSVVVGTHTHIRTVDTIILDVGRLPQ